MSAFLAFLPLLASLGGGNEIVLILDNSGSMIVTVRDADGTRYPPNDPERAAVLGALVLEGLTRGSSDQLSVVAFGDAETSPPRVVHSAEAIRSLPYTNGTWFRGPLEESRRILEASSAKDRLLFVFTDGAPTDLHHPDEAPRILGLGENPPFDTIAVGLYGSEGSRVVGEAFLRPLVRAQEDLLLLDNPRDVLGEFTAAYARAIGSLARAGRLRSGGSLKLEVGKYVSEVLVMTASSQPGPPFVTSLQGPAGAIPVQAEGDNGCPASVAPLNAPNACGAPRRHYRVFRAPNNPDRPSTWTLQVNSSPGPVEYGVILRYDLAAEVEGPEQVEVGSPATFRARLLSRGQLFDDEAFFRVDGFQATLRVGTAELPLQHQGGGVFEAEWLPSEASDEPLEAVATFSNDWLRKSARTQIQPQGALDLRLVADPPLLELGSWRGERQATSRCATVDLRRSQHADRIPLTCSASGTLPEGSLRCDPLPGSEAVLPKGARGQPLIWEVCLDAPPCCSAIAPEDLEIQLSGRDAPHQEQLLHIPIRVQVESTGWLACWWPWLSGGFGSLFGLWFFLGWIRPHSFDPASSLRIAASELGLRRSASLSLADLPGGRRSFYRNARVSVNGGGDFLRSPRNAVLCLEAGAAGSSRFRHAPGLEKKNRKGQWEVVCAEELALGYAPNVVYRIADLYLRFD